MNDMEFTSNVDANITIKGVPSGKSEWNGIDARIFEVENGLKFLVVKFESGQDAGIDGNSSANAVPVHEMWANRRKDDIKLDLRVKSANSEIQLCRIHSGINVNDEGTVVYQIENADSPNNHDELHLYINDIEVKKVTLPESPFISIEGLKGQKFANDIKKGSLH